MPISISISYIYMPISSYKKSKKIICDIRREDFGFKSKSTPPQCKQHME